jgi:hypothetical protein
MMMMRGIIIGFMTILIIEKATSTCEPGFRPSSLGCEECVNGTASVDGTECIPCPVNSYASLSGSSECMACPHRTKTTSVGSDLCRLCKLGDIWESTSTNCEDFWKMMNPFGTSTILPRPTTGTQSGQTEANVAYITGTGIGIAGVVTLCILVLGVVIRFRIVKRSSYASYEAVDSNVVTVNLADDDDDGGAMDYEEEEEEVSL